MFINGFGGNSDLCNLKLHPDGFAHSVGLNYDIKTPFSVFDNSHPERMTTF